MEFKFFYLEDKEEESFPNPGPLETFTRCSPSAVLGDLVEPPPKDNGLVGLAPELMQHRNVSQPV